VQETKQQHHTVQQPFTCPTLHSFEQMYIEMITIDSVCGLIDRQLLTSVVLAVWPLMSGPCHSLLYHIRWSKNNQMFAFDN